MAHILIIDDSPTEQAGLSQMLQKHGHICSFANTGEIGIATAKKSKPDVILMDVVMPETNGFQATAKLLSALPLLLLLGSPLRQLLYPNASPLVHFQTPSWSLSVKPIQ